MIKKAPRFPFGVVRGRRGRFKARNSSRKEGGSICGEAREFGKEWAKEVARANLWFKKVMESQDAFEAKWKAVGDTRYLEYK